jgi:hypothetical protein
MTTKKTKAIPTKVCGGCQNFMPDKDDFHGSCWIGGLIASHYHDLDAPPCITTVSFPVQRDTGADKCAWHRPDDGIKPWAEHKDLYDRRAGG